MFSLNYFGGLLDSTWSSNTSSSSGNQSNASTSAGDSVSATASDGGFQSNSSFQWIDIGSSAFELEDQMYSQDAYYEEIDLSDFDLL